MRHFGLVLTSCVAVLVLSGCATGVKGSPRRECYDAGLQPGTAEFENCWRSIARSQGTILYDDPAVVDLLTGAINARNARNSPVAGAAEAATGSSAISAQPRFLVTRTAQDVYSASNGMTFVTQYCYVFTHSQPAIVYNRRLVFLTSSQQCQITKVLRP